MAASIWTVAGLSMPLSALLTHLTHRRYACRGAARGALFLLPLQSGCMARALRPAGPPRPHRDKRTAPARRGLFFYGPVALYLMSIPPKTQLAFR